MNTFRFSVVVAAVSWTAALLTVAAAWFVR